MQITVVKETEPQESRVALVPESVKKLTGMKVNVAVESGAGVESGASDADYEAAGASISSDRGGLLAAADVLVKLIVVLMSDGAVNYAVFLPEERGE